MTVLEKIKTKNINELVDWIDEYFAFDTAPYWRFFDENYCNKCDGVIANEGEDDEMELAYCEAHGNCRFFKDMDKIPDSKQIIKMWLLSECE